MICLHSNDMDPAESLALDQLFVKLQRARTAGERQELVSNALASGLPVDEVREMLDYLESCCDKLPRSQVVSSPIWTKSKTAPNGSWASFFFALFNRYR